MINWRHESLFPRLTAASAASHRYWTEPGRGGQNLFRFGSHDQTLPQAPTRNGSRVAQNDSRSPCGERSRVTGALETATRSPSRCDTRRTLSSVPSSAWHPGQPGQHQSRQGGFGLDTKKKTLVASEQNETARFAWREQASQLPTQD